MSGDLVYVVHPETAVAQALQGGLLAADYDVVSMSTVSEVEERAEGVKLAASFSEIDPETRQAVQQYAKDMAFLRKELRQATEEE